MEMSAEAAASPAPGKARRRIALALIVVATVLALLAIFALWANRQLLNTDNWVDTSSELLEHDAIRTQIADFAVEQLYANVDVQGELEKGFSQVVRPAAASALAGPAASGLRTFAEQSPDNLLERPRLQQAWEQANRRAHARFLDIVEGGGDTVSTSGGEVSLDLKSLLGQTQGSLGVGGRVAGKLPADAADIVILRSDQLELAQDLVRFLKAVAIVLLVLSLGLFALAVYLARGWRREALRAVGIGFLFAGAVALVARALAGNAVVDALATTESVRPAAEATWSTGTSLLVQAATATLIYGAVIVVAAWVAGPTSWAVATRRNLAPYLREPRFAWGAFGLVVLLLVAWGRPPPSASRSWRSCSSACWPWAWRRSAARRRVSTPTPAERIRFRGCASGRAASAGGGRAPLPPRLGRPPPQTLASTGSNASADCETKACSTPPSTSRRRPRYWPRRRRR